MFKSPKGMADLLPDQAPAWQEMESKLRQILTTFDFEEIRTPILEDQELFTRSVGKTTDIVEKEMFAFTDQGGNALALRPEGTAPVLRAYLENHLDHGHPIQKLYYLGPFFRHERPQKGRMRQFHQLGAESIGSDHPYVDVEMLHLAMTILENFEVPQLELQINSVGDEKCRPPYRKLLQAYLQDHQKDLCENCQRRTATNPLRVFDCKNRDCQKTLEKAPQLIQHLCDPCKKHFSEVQEGLQKLSVRFRENTRIVRGLDYYTRTAFEITAGGLGAQNAVTAGGRYDGLAQQMGGASTPGIGFAMGLERLLLAAKYKLGQQKRTKILFTPLSPAAEGLSLECMTTLRRTLLAKSLPAQIDLSFEVKSLKSALRRADREGAAWVVIMGEDELKKNCVMVRNLKERTQEEIELSRLTDTMVERLT